MTATLARSQPATRRRRRLVVALAALIVLTLAALVLFTPALGVRTVEVTGAGVLTADEVRSATGLRTGTPMLRADLAAAAARVEGLSEVRTATVTRDWPWNLRVEVTERTVAAAMAVGDEWRVFDVDGTEFGRVTEVDAAVPRLDPGRQGASARMVASMLEVFAALPSADQAVVQRLKPLSEQDLRMIVAGAEVRFGSADDATEKARVLAALRQSVPNAPSYDVSAPDAPAVGGADSSDD